MAETAHFNCLYEDGPENALWKGKWGCLCHAVCPKGLWGSFKKDVCSSTIMSSWTPYMFTCTLILYTAVTERSWCHPLLSPPRGQIYSFCIIILCPCTVKFFPTVLQNIHAVPEYHLRSFPPSCPCSIHHQAFSSASQSGPGGSDQQ